MAIYSLTGQTIDSLISLNIIDGENSSYSSSYSGFSFSDTWSKGTGGTAGSLKFNNSYSFDGKEYYFINPILTSVTMSGGSVHGALETSAADPGTFTFSAGTSLGNSVVLGTLTGATKNGTTILGSTTYDYDYTSSTKTPNQSLKNYMSSNKINFYNKCTGTCFSRLYSKNIKFTIEFGARVRLGNPVNIRTNTSITDGSAGSISASDGISIGTTYSDLITTGSLTFKESDHYVFKYWKDNKGNTWDTEQIKQQVYVDGETIYTPYVEPRDYRIQFGEYDIEDVKITINDPNDLRKQYKTFTILDNDIVFTDLTAYKGIEYKFIGWKEQKASSVSPNPLILDCSLGEDRFYTSVFDWQDFNLTLLDGIDNHQLSANDLVIPSEFCSTYRYIDTVKINKAKRFGHNFIGWQDADGNISETLEFTKVAAPRTYTAIFEPIEYSVEYGFDSSYLDKLPIEGQNLISLNNNLTVVTVNTNHMLIHPILPAYDFSGWYEEKGGLIPKLERKENVVVTIQTDKELCDRKYMAYYEPHDYTITYNLDGGIISENNPTIWNIAQGKKRLINPTKAGYEFTGWKEANVYPTPNTEAYIEILATTQNAKNRHFEAVFKPIGYVVEYEFDSSYMDGLPIDDIDLVAINDHFTALEVEKSHTLKHPELPAYDFIGWYENGEYNSIPKSNPQKDVTVIIENLETDLKSRNYVAYYEPHEFNITYNLHGGIIEGNENPVKWDISKGSQKLTNPTRVGYTFKGWVETNVYPTKTLEAYIEILATEENAVDRHFEAIFEKNIYNINYDYSWTEDNNENYLTITGIVENDKNPENYGIYANDISGLPTYPPVVLTTPTLEDTIKDGYSFESWYVKIKDPMTNEWSESVELGESAELRITEDTIGDRQYNVSYKPIPQNIEYIYDTIHDRQISNINQLTSVFTCNKDCLLVEPIRPGYDFDCFKLNGLVLNNNIIPKGTLPGKKTIEIAFTQKSKKITTEIYVRNNRTGAISNFTDTDKIPMISFDDGEGRQTIQKKDETGSVSYELTTPYRDRKTIVRTIVDNSFDENKYKFIGWFKNISDIEPLSTEITVEQLLDPDQNSFIALFELIDYTVNVYLQDISNGSINNLELGELLFKIPEHAEKVIDTSDIYNPKIFIKYLQLGDNCKFSIIPHIINGQRYIFDSWNTTTDTVLNITVVPEWRQTDNIESVKARFAKVDFINTIGKNPDKEDSEEDKDCLNTLIQKTINSFVVINRLSTLGDRAFYNCKDLKYVFMPGVKRLGNNSFEGCTSLRNVIISTKDVTGTGIGENAFANCPNLNLLILPDDFIECNTLFNLADADDNNPQNHSLFKQGFGKIYVPNVLVTEIDGSQRRLIDIYKTTSNWSIYANCFEEITDDIYQSPYIEI